MTKFKKYRNNIKCCQGRGETKLFINCWWECKIVVMLEDCVWQFPTKLNMHLLYDPAIALLGIYPRELKMYVPIKPEHD